MRNYTQKAMEARLIRECDKLWRRIILLDADCHCQICGSPTAADAGRIIWVQACHIITRGNWATRWDKRNGVAGCQACHNHKTIMNWLEETDKARYNWIIAQKQIQVSHRDIDLEKILKKLRAA